MTASSLEGVLLEVSREVGRKGRAAFEELFLQSVLPDKQGGRPENGALHVGDVVKEADDPRTIQTGVDRMCKAAFHSALQSFPGLNVITEEGGRYTFPGTLFKHYTVVIDDWDGSTNGNKGLNLSAISVGLDCRGKSYLGYWYDPYREYLIYTQDIDPEGFGAVCCFLDTVPRKVSPFLRTPVRAQTLSEARLVIHRGTKLHPVSELHCHPLSTLGAQALAVMNFESSVISLMHVAMGMVDGFVVAGNKPWDLWGAWAIFKALNVPFAFMEPFTYRVLAKEEITPDPEKEYAFVCANNAGLMAEIMRILQAK